MNQTIKNPGLETRFAFVREFMRDKGVRNYTSVFNAFGLHLDEKRLTLLWNGRANPTADDAPMISQMERVMEVLKNSPDITKAAA